MKKTRPILFFALALLSAGIAALALSQTASIPGVVEVFSDEAEYQGSRSVFSGNVTLAAGRMTLSADRLEVEVGEDGNIYRASGAPVRIECAACFGGGTSAQADSVRYSDADGAAVASGGARVCSGPDCASGELSAEELEWRRGENIFIARGAPGNKDGAASLIWNPPGGESIAVSAREIRYDCRLGPARLSGAAEAVRGESSLRGDIIIYNRKTGAMRAEADSEGGRVRAVFGVEDAAENP